LEIARRAMLCMPFIVQWLPVALGCARCQLSLIKQ
jgi:hypothetical protein